MFLISYKIMSFIIFKSFAYSYHLLLCFMSAYTLKVDTGNNCMYSKILSLQERWAGGANFAFLAHLWPIFHYL